MSRLRIRGLANIEDCVKAAYEKKISYREGKNAMDKETKALLKQMKYGEYGTNVIQPNTRALRNGREDFKLRGVIGAIRMAQVAMRLEDLNAVVYRCKFFSLWFYPVDHFLAMARKSKPAIHFHYQKDLFLNGRIPIEKTCEQFTKKWGRLISVQGSLVPKHWAYMRVRVRKWARPVFNEAWNELRAPDGVYLYKIEVFPDVLTRNEFEKHISKSVKVVCQLDMANFRKDKQGRDWIEHANNRVSIKMLNNLLKNESIPFRYEKVRTNE